jgi:hypothetical protein
MGRFRRRSPEKRVAKQVRDLQANTLRTLNALAKRPTERKTRLLLTAHDQRARQIVNRGQPRPRPKPAPYDPFAEVWTSNPYLKLLWSLTVMAVVLLVFAFAEWWALIVFPVGWFVSLNFVYTITVPILLLIGVIVVLGTTGIRF